MHGLHLYHSEELVIFFRIEKDVNISKMKLLLLTVLVVAMAYQVRLLRNHLNCFFGGFKFIFHHGFIHFHYFCT